MPKNIGILFVASEAEPFIKTGTIGSIAGNLPKAIKTLGHDIRVIIPGYSSISPRKFQIHNLLRMKNIEVPIASTSELADVRSSYLCTETNKILIYFLSNERYFNREGLYYHPGTKKYFPDNDERFTFFCRGILESLKRLHWQPDIIHCNDWQSALIPAYLKTIYRNDPYFKNIRTIFTIYNLTPSCAFPMSSLEKTGLPSNILNYNGESDKELNFLKIGLTYADVITTYGNKVDQVRLKSCNDGLEKVLQKRVSRIVQITQDTTIGKESLALQLLEIYRHLAKNNG